jgi:flagellar biosynthesis chaperone FliJ
MKARKLNEMHQDINLSEINATLEEINEELEYLFDLKNEIVRGADRKGVAGEISAHLRIIKNMIKNINVEINGF